MNNRCNLYKYIDNLLNQDDLMLEYEINSEIISDEPFEEYIDRYIKRKSIIYENPMEYYKNGNILKYVKKSPSLYLEFYKNTRYKSSNINKIINNNKFTIIPISLSEFKKDNNKHHFGHSILAIYIKKEDKFYILDLSGAAYKYDYFIESLNNMFEKYEILDKMNELQQREYRVEYYNGESVGYCVSWCYLFIICYIIDNENYEIVYIIYGILCACDGNPITLRKLIRNFT